MNEPFAVLHTYCANCAEPLDRPTVCGDFCDEVCATELEEYDPEVEYQNQEIAGLLEDDR